MTYAQAQRWLGLYFLIITSVIGVYVLVASETVALPISHAEGAQAFQIIIPMFLGQITVMFRWFGHQDSKHLADLAPIPTWAIVTPPILAALIIVSAAVALIINNLTSTNGVSGIQTSAFNTAVTLSVGILNASTVFLVTRLFPAERSRSARKSGKPSIPSSVDSGVGAGQSQSRPSDEN